MDLNRAEWIGELLIGWSMGLAVVVPGLSAATMALLFGVYRKWLSNISRLRIQPLRFLLAGVVGGILSGVQIISWGAEVRPDALSALFLGILSVFILGFARENRPRGVTLIMCASAFLAAWYLALLSLVRPVALHGTNGPAMAVAGAAGAAAMALPGISGGTLLILMGLYYATIEMVAEFDWVSVLWFGGGAIVGVFAVARLFRKLLLRWRGWVMSGLIGLMAGSMRALLPSQWDAVTIAAFIAGILVSAAVLFIRDNGVGEL